MELSRADPRAETVELDRDGVSTEDQVPLEEGGQPGPPDDGAPALPRLFGRYELRRELGRGGAGMVWEAFDPALQRPVALKTLLAGRWASPDQRARFLREVRATANLRHPHIVGVHDAGEVDGIAYLTMDLIDGQPLDGLLERDGALPPRRAAELLLPVARALAHAHREGIVHRDVKPENVLVAADGTPYLSDFGLARDLGDGQRLTGSGQTVGTPAFMAPEQLRGRAVDGRTDVYALGATIYECLSGVVPFQGESYPELVAKVLHEDPPPLRQAGSIGGPPRRVAPDLEAIVLRCLEKDPARRYAGAGELAQDLERFLRGEAVEARPPGRLRRLARRARGQTQLVVGVALAGAGLAGGLVHAALLRSELAVNERVRAALERDRERILAQRADALHRSELEATRRLALAEAALAPTPLDGVRAYDALLLRYPELWEARLSRARLLREVAAELRARDKDPAGARITSEQAVEDLEVAAELAPARAPFLLLAAEVLRTDLQDQPRARAAYEELAREGPPGLAAYAQARLAHLGGRGEAARVAVEQAVAARPDLAPARVLRAELLLRAGQHGAALEELDRVAAHALAEPEALRLRAEALLGAGALDEALRDAARAAELEPGSWVGQVILGKVRLRQGDRGRATAAFERARRLVPQEPQVHVALAAAHLAFGDPAASLAELAEARRLGLPADDPEGLALEGQMKRDGTENRNQNRE